MTEMEAGAGLLSALEAEAARVGWRLTVTSRAAPMRVLVEHGGQKANATITQDGRLFLEGSPRLQAALLIWKAGLHVGIVSSAPPKLRP